MLVFPPDLPAPGELLLVTDELPSPGDFLLHRALNTHLKKSKTHQCILLSVSEGFDRWKVIAAKSNINLSVSFDFIDVLKTVKPTSTTVCATLRPILDVLAAILESKKTDPVAQALVILDDITSLEWIGFPFLDIVRFSRALRALCLQSKASLIIRHHLVTPGPDELLRHLSQICSYHMDVRALSSGRSGSVSGEVALHIGPSTNDKTIVAISRSSAVQYRLTDSGAVFFERGTCGGVL